MGGETLETFLDHSPALLFVAAPDGSLLHTSRTLRQRFAQQLGDAPSLAALADPEDAPLLSRMLGQLAQGEPSAESVLRCTQPNGDRLELRCAVHRAEDGLLHGHIEAELLADAQRERIERTLLHTIMQTLEIALWAVDEHGVCLFHDGKALETAGLEPGQFLGLNLFEQLPPSIADPVRKAFDGEVSHGVSETRGVSWENWHIPLPLAHGPTGCAGIILDISDRVSRQRDLEQRIETIRSQQRAIYELSAPILNIWDSVLTVPLIGIMDHRRTNELTERLLEAAHRGQTRFVIVDLTGVEAVDTSIAAHVLRLLESLRLLGVEAMVTGVSPEVARTMVAVGIDFESVTTHRTLREGLAACIRTLYALASDS